MITLQGTALYEIFTLERSCIQAVAKRHATAFICMAENFVMVGDERLEIMQFHR